MKKISTENIKEIERFLDKHKIKYIDIRLEILDHIICDIEENYLSVGISFEEAFPSATKKWEHHFTQTSSFLFGLAYTEPKIVIEKAKHIYKPIWLSTIVFFLIYYLLFFRLIINVPSIYVESVKLSMLLLFGLITVLGFILMRKHLISKEKTIYSFILKTQTLNIIIWPVFSLILILAGLDILHTLSSFVFMHMFMVLVYLYFIRKHLKTLKDYKVE